MDIEDIEYALQRIADTKKKYEWTLRLTGLDLVNLPEEILELEWLEILNLSENQIQDFSALQHLTQLRSLELSKNQIQDLTSLQHLTQLERLNLSENQIQDLTPLQYLTQLEWLELNANQIQDFSALQHLTHLHSLELDRNRFQDFSPLVQYWTELGWKRNENKIQDFSTLQHLTRLEWLKLNENQIQDLSFLQHLTQLRSLQLSNNPIQDFSTLQHLTRLGWLDLNANQIQDLTPLQHLTQLRSLELSKNQIQDLTPLQHLTQLRSLVLSKNQIQDLTPLQHLTQLEWLNLSENQIQDLTPLQHLTQLRELELNANQISKIEQLKRVTEIAKLYKLTFKNNHVKEIPQELVETSNNSLKALRDYFKDLAQSGIAFDNELKLVLLGNGRVGKTSLYKRLIYNSFDKNEKSTHAIQLVKWQFSLTSATNAPAPNEFNELIINIWDFGGQDIYHATHRLFMQTQALFVLAWDLDTEQRAYSIDTSPSGETVQYPNYPLPYWLNYAKTLGRNSPIIIVQTKIINVEAVKQEQLPNRSELLKAKYAIVRFEHIDSAEPPLTGTGFSQLKHTIQNTALDILTKNGAKLPHNWYQLRTRIKELVKHHSQISLENFRLLCRENGVEDTSVGTVLEYLHNSGVLFYRYGLFRNQIIIDQKWVIDAVYTLFDREKLFYRIKEGRNGKFTLSELKWVWDDYSIKEQLLFISFMKSCEICYEVTGERDWQLKAEQRVYLAPALLADQKPSRVEGAWKRREGLYLQFHHEYLHYGIMQSFIVRMGNLATVTLYDIWKNGVWINHADGEALIEAIPTSKIILVQVRNNGQKQLLEKIHREFNQIQGNESDVQEWVSLDGENYVNLLELREKYQKRHQHITSREGNEFQVRDFAIFLHLDEGVRFKEDTPTEKLEMEPLHMDKLKVTMMEKLQIKLFISYCHKDEKVKEQFDQALAVLKNLGKVDVWQDRQLLAGEEFEKSIVSNIEKAQIVCLLISPAFMNSQYCFGKEMQAALHKYEAGTGVVVPIIIKATPLWHEFKIGKFNAVPTDGKPVSEHRNKEAAWKDVIEKLNKLVDSLRSKA